MVTSLNSAIPMAFQLQNTFLFHRAFQPEFISALISVKQTLSEISLFISAWNKESTTNKVLLLWIKLMKICDKNNVFR